MTGLGHRNAFRSTLERQRRASLARPAPLLVVLIDVDDFKAVNDERGHAAGDAMLLAICRVLHASLRDGDELFRIGGDEFATVLRLGDVGEAEGIVERLVHACREAGGCTVSIGATRAVAAEDDATLLARADAALYAAKAAGRDGWRLL